MNEINVRMQEFIWEAISFEQWLRFFFLQDDPNDPENAIIFVPEVWVQKCEKANLELIPLLNACNNKQVSLELSRQHVITHVFENLSDAEKKAFQVDMIEEVLSLLKKELNYFNAFVQDKEEQSQQELNKTELNEENGAEKCIENPQEDLQIISFGAWMEEYKTYKEQLKI